MKLRVALGAVLLIYAMIGYSVQFIPAVAAYYLLARANFSGNPSMSSAFSLFNPFSSSVLQSFFWFAYCLGLGFFLILFRKLQTKQKPPWTRPISNSKSLG